MPGQCGACCSGGTLPWKGGEGDRWCWSWALKGDEKFARQREVQKRERAR